MWYLRLYNRMRRWEDGLYERKGWSFSHGSPALLVFAFAIPTIAFLLVAPAMVRLLGVSEEFLGYVLIGLPLTVYVCLIYFGE